MMKYLAYLLGISSVFFILTLQLFSAYFGAYGIPFGQSDVDRYMCWFGYHLSHVPSCGPIDAEALKIHFFLYYLVLFMGEPGHVLTFMVPFVIWFVIPILVFWMSYLMLRELRGAFYATLLFMFGNFTLLFFGFTSTWSQMLAFVFFVCSMIFYLEGARVFFYLAFILSVMSHPFIGFVYVLFFYGIIVRDRRWKVLWFCLLVSVVGFVLRGYAAFTTMLGDYPVEPPLYYMVAFYTCPVLWSFFFLGLRRDDRLFWFIVFLFVCMPFVQLGRGMMFFYMFFSVAVYRGLKSLNNKYLSMFVGLFVVLYFSWFFGWQLDIMLKEMVLRDLDPDLLRNILYLGVSP